MTICKQGRREYLYPTQKKGECFDVNVIKSYYLDKER